LRPSPSGMAVADALVNTILVSPSQRPRPPARTMIEPWES
jgi:hypothetical protein